MDHRPYRRAMSRRRTELLGLAWFRVPAPASYSTGSSATMCASIPASITQPEPGQFAETYPGSSHIEFLHFERCPGGPPAGIPWNAIMKAGRQQSAG
jgi:hypothetical protein